MKTEIRTAALQVIDRKGLSDAEAARGMKMSGATWSNMKNGNWESISPAMWQKVAAWCGFSYNDWKLRETKQLQAILNLLNDAQENCRMLALAAATGLGKTTGINYYFKNNGNVFKVLCTVTMSKKDFLAAIQSALGGDVEGSVHHRMESIVERLSTLDHPLLILDDAGKLNDGCLRLIQVIYDSTEFRAGIVLAGTLQLRHYILKMAAKDKQGFRELKRRIGYWETLMPLSRHIIKAFCDDFAIKGDNAIDFLCRTCADFGTLREMLTNAQRLAKKEGSEITLDVLADVHVGDAVDRFKAA